MVRERPILFSGPMVRALLDGRKTQTRRVLKPQPDDLMVGQIPSVLRISIGDRLWVRETWALSRSTSEPDDLPDGDFCERVFFQDGMITKANSEAFHNLYDGLFRWRPSIHMPRWASRLTLTVTDVRVQRVQDISEEDARAEGVATTPMFRTLWDDINGPGSWDANPWVAAITFTVERNDA